MDWKEKFLELLVSNDVNMYGEALDLKGKNFPKKLYRYRSVSDQSIQLRIREIVFGEVYLSHPKEFNDPLEASSLLQYSNLSRYLSESKEKYKELFSKRLEPERFSSIFGEEDWFEQLVIFVAEQTALSEKVDTTKKLLGEIIRQEVEEFNFEVNRVSRNNIRIACFTTKPDNLPMWHHYADGHKGVCLEYNTDDIADIYQRNRLLPVFYVNHLPDITYMMMNKMQPKFDLFKYMSIHKLKDWEYEDEWRLLYDAGSWFRSPEDVPEEFWDCGRLISFIRPSRIILGINIEERHEKEIRRTAKMGNILVEKAEKTQYGLKFS